MGSTLKGRFWTRSMLAVALCTGILGAAAQHAGADIPPERSLQLLPTTGAVGTVVVARGQLTGPGPLVIWSQPVAIYFGGRLVAKTSTDGSGAFVARFQVPPSAELLPHYVTVRAVGQRTYQSLAGNFYMK